MKTETKHSPLPWSWADRTDKDSANLGGFVDANGKDVCDFGNCETYYPTSGNEPSEADRALILQAVNSYSSSQAEVARLREALTLCADTLDSIETATCGMSANHALHVARAALQSPVDTKQ